MILNLTFKGMRSQQKVHLGRRILTAKKKQTDVNFEKPKWMFPSASPKVEVLFSFFGLHF